MINIIDLFFDIYIIDMKVAKKLNCIQYVIIFSNLNISKFIHFYLLKSKLLSAKTILFLHS